jgi:signal peptidase
VKPELSIKKGDSLSIGGTAFVELVRTVLEKGVPFRFQARGISMSPFIKDGDIITVFPLSGVLPRLGDVVAFVNPCTTKLAVHRVVGKKNHAFLIMGDRSPTTDGMISKTNILGCVMKVERNGKAISFGFGPERILIAFLTRTGLLLRLLLPAWRFIRPIDRKSAP